MRISISNIAWDTKDDEAVCSILQRQHVDAIDIAPGKYFSDFATATPHQIKKVRDWWAERGIEIIGMQSLLYGTQGLNLFDAPEVQQRILSHLIDVCRIGNGLNARRLVFGSPRNRDRTGLSDDQALEIATVFFKRLADVAQQHNVTICLEPNPECYGSNFMTTSEETASVVRAVDHPALRMQFDTGALCINGESPASVCADFQHLIGHVHASDPQLVPVGTGATEHYQAALALREFLPDAPVTIEMLTTSVEDSLTAVEQSVRYVTDCYGPSSGTKSS
jgi:D-psicose/D-tagatose/L-ribulose 3-epimerase